MLTSNHSKENRDTTGVEGAILYNSPKYTHVGHHVSPIVRHKIHRGVVMEHKKNLSKERRYGSEGT